MPRLPRPARLTVAVLEDRTTPVAGTMDTSFGGGDGIARFNLPGFFSVDARGVAVQPDGRLAAVGAGEVSGMGQHVVARYLADGTLDNTFDTDGRVLLQYQPDAQGGVLHAVAADQRGRP